MQAISHWISTQDHQKIFAKTWGDPSKPALLLVHGYPDHQAVWEPVLAYLIQDFYLVTYDVRGAGQSTVPKRIRDYTLARLSLDLECVIDAILPNQQVHLAAHDWGSIQTWESITDPKFKQRILSYSSISGPCLDHAALWMRDQLQHEKPQFFKQLFKSWYIAAFQLPFLAPMLWQLMNPQRWGKVLSHLEQTENLPLNHNICADGQHGINLYRANFLPRLTRPRSRFAQCPVQAIVLTQDNFVSPQLIDEIPQWADVFERVEINANHWAILSRPQEIAEYIQTFALKHHHP